VKGRLAKALLRATLLYFFATDEMIAQGGQFTTKQVPIYPPHIPIERFTMSDSDTNVSGSQT
jgi:hypothetical protein